MGALIFWEEKLLLVTSDKTPYYYTVGGRVAYNETCEEAVLREVKGELGVELEIDRAVFFCESLFEEQVTKEQVHEIGVYFLMKPSGQLLQMSGTPLGENGEQELLRWIPLKELNQYTVFPRFLKTELSELPDGCRLIIDNAW